MGKRLLAAFSLGVALTTGVFLLLRGPAPQVAEPEESSAAGNPEDSSPRVFRAVSRRPAARAFQPPPLALRKPPEVRPVVVDAQLPELRVRMEPELGPLAPPALPPRPEHRVTLPAGTLLEVRLSERLSTEASAAGDSFLATLDHPLVADGWVIAERGARVVGRIVDADAGGRLRGVASLTLELATLTTSDGQKIPLRTAPFVRKAGTTRQADAAKVAVGAAIGAAIGAAAGGGQGAGIGAASGGAAGAGAVLLTRGNPAELAAETRLRFRLEEPVTITER
jgi:hypothetical protein